MRHWYYKRCLGNRQTAIILEVRSHSVDLKIWVNLEDVLKISLLQQHLFDNIQDRLVFRQTSFDG